MRKSITTYCRVISQCLILALLLNAALPSILSLINAASDEQSSLFGDKILICTSTGAKYISIADYENGNLPADYDPRPHCPLCILNLAMADAHIPASITIKRVQPPAMQVYYYAFAENNYNAKAALHTRSRAPPRFL